MNDEEMPEFDLDDFYRARNAIFSVAHDYKRNGDTEKSKLWFETMKKFDKLIEISEAATHETAKA